jgi:menaquinone-dependent protoporphyrinogen oxidase
LAYATCHGSTESIARHIARRIDPSGAMVECVAMRNVEDVTSYDAFVLGSAVHDQAWLPEAAEFVTRFGEVLVGRPVWLFSVGMPAALPGRIRGWAMQEEGFILAKLAADLSPCAHRLLSGVVRREHLTSGGRMKFRLMGGRYGDFRDWDEIEEWATLVAQGLEELLATDRRP